MRQKYKLLKFLHIYKNMIQKIFLKLHYQGEKPKESFFRINFQKINISQTKCRLLYSIEEEIKCTANITLF
jgi:hypothetical protein